MNTRGWIIFVAAVVVLFGGLIVLSNKNKIDVSDVDGNSILAGSEKNGNIADHVYGKKDSKVVLLEYGDYQCPGCEGAHPNIKTLSEKYKGQIAFVFRNLPLTNLHPNARAAAAAAEAANLQGKFWAMHNLLFENQDTWKDADTSKRTEVFTDFAKTLDLDVAKFTADLESASVNRKISFDQALAKKADATGTPTFILNGEKVADDVVSDAIQGEGSKLEALIVAKLKDAGIDLPKETTK